MELQEKSDELLIILKASLFQSPPPFKQLAGRYKEIYPRRINYKDRLIHETREPTTTDSLGTTAVIRMRTYYHGLVPEIFF